MNKIAELEKDIMKKNITKFNVGDTVKVFVKIKEGDKTRLQGFEGTVIAKKGSSVRETFTVRRISYGEGVERVFQLHSPLIDSIKVVKEGKVKRAKLYYLRKKIGKNTKIEEKRPSASEEDASVGEKSVS
ncbi:MAG: 50S ribosomal protein L19 [Candidatus Omnitrophota bacterium]